MKSMSTTRQIAATSRLVSVAWLATMAVCFAGQAVEGAAVGEIEPNDSILAAQNVDAFFTLDFDANVGNTIVNTSELVPHVTVLGTGDGTFDYYSFTVANAGDTGVFDIDFGTEGGFDSHLRLYNAGGGLLDANDDSSVSWGRDGSISSLDSYLEYIFPAAGIYAIEVGSCCVGTVPNGASYQLQISIGPPPPPPGPPLPLSPGIHVITFDELNAEVAPIPHNYFGLDWDNMSVINGPVEHPVSGYANGIVSGVQTAFNLFAEPAGTMTVSGDPFDFLGAYFTAAWNNGLSITVEGYLNGILQYTSTFQVDTAGPTFVPLNYLNVDELRFRSFGGVDAGLPGGGEHFAMDNFTFRVIPEPSTLVLGVMAWLGWCSLPRRGAKT